MNGFSNKLMIGAGVLVLAVVVMGVLGTFLPTTGLFSSSAKEEVTLGALIPLTGNYSTIGNNVRNGMELAKTEYTKQSANTVVQIKYEDACQAKDTTSAFKKLTEVDNIDLLGASFCIVGFVPLIPVAAEKKIISFSVAASPDALLDKPYVFSLNKSIQSDARDMVNYAISAKNAKKAGIVFYNTQLGADYNKYLTMNFIQNGGTVVGSYVTELDRTDFRTELTQIKENGADVVFIIQLANSLGLFVKETRELGLPVTIITQSTAEDPTVIDAAQGAAEGMIISSSQPKTITPEILAFNAKYEQVYGKKPDALAAIGYDSFMLELTALTKCNKKTECVLNELRSVKNYSGASGIVTMGSDGATLREPHFKIVKDGAFVEIK